MVKKRDMKKEFARKRAERLKRKAAFRREIKERAAKRAEQWDDSRRYQNRCPMCNTKFRPLGQQTMRLFTCENCGEEFFPVPGCTA